MKTDTVSVAGVKVQLSSWGSGSNLDSRWLAAKDAAKLIRLQLKARWPSVKFSVRTNHGNSVDVEWTDGPTASEVDAVGRQYAAGRFDGMVDYAYTVDHWLNTKTGEAVVAHDPGSAFTGGYSEEYTAESPGKEWVKVHSSMKYFGTHRRRSAEKLREVAEKVCAEYGHEKPPKLKDSLDGYAWYEQDATRLFPGSRDTLSDAIHRAYGETSFVEAETVEPPAEEDSDPGSFELKHDRDWTWLTFPDRPADSVLEALKSAGGRFSRRRKAWYFKRHVEAADLGLSA